MEDYEGQFEAWLELERAAIRAELKLKERAHVESAPERIAKFKAAAALRREAEALMSKLLL